ncbi:MAG: Fic family protein [Chloroflexi bacterium]|nr:Fic family protein [Chloroflexota bacterium]
MLFHSPPLDEQEADVCARVDELRLALRGQVSEQRRWTGLLRRVASARAIQGSNSIEGLNVSLDDAVAAVGGGEPLDAPVDVWAAIQGYREAMTFVLQLADDPHFEYDASLIRSLHYMMMQYDLGMRPGRWRSGPVYVRDERSGDIGYEGPDAIEVPGLMEEMVAELGEQDPAVPAVVRGAMAHLNLVMIHPFRDGNGRMARGLQALVLAREGMLETAFASIEEYLGRNTDAYYDVLAEVGGGAWQPQRDARPWVRFTLTAHYRQAWTLLRRAAEGERRSEVLELELSRRRLPERSVFALWDAAQGFRVRNATYRELAEVSLVVAGRDLKALSDSGLLVAQGQARGRYYVASNALKTLEASIRRDRTPIPDPFEEDRRQQALPLGNSNRVA